MSAKNHLGKVKPGKDVIALNIIAYTFCTLMALVCLVPFIMVLSGSFSSETAVTANGFSLLPQDFSLEAYKTVFRDPMTVVRAYATTIILTIVGTILVEKVLVHRFPTTKEQLQSYDFDTESTGLTPVQKKGLKIAGIAELIFFIIMLLLSLPVFGD